jgi:hypothetical protein
MGLTGALMLFHCDSGLNKIAHEWLGWALLIGVAAHLAVNRRAFTVHFRRRRAVAIMAVFLTAPGLSFAPLGGDASPARAAIMALADAPLNAVAGLTGETPAALIARMAAAGYDALADRPIAQIVGADHEAQMHMLNAALGAEG